MLERLLGAWLGDANRVSLRLFDQLIVRFRSLCWVAFVLNLAAALLEGTTMGVLALAIQILVGDVDSLSTQLGSLGASAEAYAARHGAPALFIGLIVLAVAAQVLRGVLQFGGTAAIARLQSRSEGLVRTRLFSMFMSLSFRQILRYRIGDLTSHIEQVNYLGQIFKLMNLVVSQVLMMLAYCTALLWLSWPMTLVAMIGAGAVSLVVGSIIRRIRRYGRELTRSSVRLSEHTVEFLYGLREILTFGREDFAREKVQKTIDEAVSAQQSGLVWQASVAPLVQTLTVLGVAAFLVGGYVVLGLSDSAGLAGLVTFLFVLSRILPRVKMVNDRLGVIAGYWQFIYRIASLLDPADKEYGPAGGRGYAGLSSEVEFRDVSHRYEEGGPWALRHLSFRLRRGGIVALVGESGSGKSTTADLLVRLIDPTEGSILVDGVDLRELDWQDWRDRLGVVSQETFIFNASIRDNIAFGKPEADDGQIVRAAEIAFARRFIEDYPGAFEAVVGDQGHRLSGGQRQRLSIARAVLRDPEILVLDEATSDLDSESENVIQTAIAKLLGDRTALAIAHRLSTTKRADLILVLDRGAVVERGTHAELLELDGKYSKMWQLQAGDFDPDPGP